ncbi:MAG: uracil-DNA glycosylase [Calditrichaeota bacterium]|nr:uracil-DNA glycosylase [Calditrichota bacterium]
MTIDDFIGLLESLPARALCFNPYSSGDGACDAIRRQNLRLYLTEMKTAHPDTLLVGEAPGYNGCHWSGIPFTSERQLVRGVARHGLFGPGKGYRWTSGREQGYTEPSGTILWDIIGELPRLPLVWNAFPLHPYKAGLPLSNRTPTDVELNELSFVLHALGELFHIRRHIAIGRKAEAVLAGLGIQAPGVRHPANGGKNACRDGLLALLGTPHARA